MDLAVDDLDLDAFAEIEEISGLARYNPATLDMVDCQQVDRVTRANIVIARLEFTGNLFDKDSGVINLNRLTIAETVQNGKSGVRAEAHNAPIDRSGC